MRKLLGIFLFTWQCASLSAQNEGTVWGFVSDSYGDPIEQVLVTTEDNQKVLTGITGAFELKIPADNPVKIFFQHFSYRDTLITISVKKGEKYHQNMRLVSAGIKLDMVNVRAEHTDGMTRVDPKLMIKLPSITGGIEALIKLLGATGGNEFSSQYNVRGGNYNENLIYVNDIQIYRPLLIHNAQQEGLSFVNMDLTGSVSFSAGGFEAKYGDKMSSVLDVEYKKPVAYGGSVLGSLLGASGHLEGNVNDKFTFLAGIRYKNNSLMLKAMETAAEYNPNMVDAQMLLVGNLSKKLSISLLANLSHTQYEFIPTNKETTWGPLGNVKRVQFYYEGQEIDRYSTYLGGLTFAYKPDDKNRYRLILSSYYSQERETFDIASEYWLKDIAASSDNTAQEVSTIGTGKNIEHARNNLIAWVSAADVRGDHKLRRNTIMWGFKVQNETIKDNINEWKMIDSAGYTLPHIGTTPGDSVVLGHPARDLVFDENGIIRANNSLNNVRVSGFVQDVWHIDGDSATRFTLNAGIRFQYWSYNHEIVFSPRLNFNYNPRWKHDWQFRLKTGIYYQPAYYHEMRNAKGELNKHIKSQRSFQIIAGSEYNFKMWRRPFRFTTEVYYKYMDRLIPYIVDNMRIVYNGKNEAKGYATGIEMKLSGEFIRNLESWITISLMKTAEKIRAEDGSYSKYAPRPTDQVFSTNIFFQDHVPFLPQLRMHLNFVFASGLPYGNPDMSERRLDLRSSWYRRVDVGIAYMLLEQSRDRKKHKNKLFRAVKNAGIYFEIYNLLDIHNVSSYQWVYAYDNSRYAVPNYLTPRLINLKFAIEF